ncbi:hypothetical protein BOTU111921_15795 [Bordetella tumbae]|uniref:ankyrin repeat domain-containing protein n=1 Tax=Bordetella tumbae TaxID=1649139 RepID=UPI0039EFC666
MELGIGVNRSNPGLSEAISEMPASEMSIDKETKDAKVTITKLIESNDKEAIQGFFSKPHSVELIAGLAEKGELLHRAADLGHADMIELLVRNLPPQALNARNQDGSTPLILAAKHGNVDVVKTLLTAGASPDMQDNRGLTALIYAALSGALEVIKMLLGYASAGDVARSAPAADIHAQDNEGKNALMRALENKHFDVAALLLENKADVHARAKDGATAGMLAALSGHIVAINLLAKYGANFNDEDSIGRTALAYAADSPKESIDGVVQALLKNNADINFKNEAGNTPLIAAFDNRSEGLLSLIKVGADVNAQRANGDTLLIDAARDNDFERVKFLTENGADVNKAGNYRKTPLMHALPEENGKLVKFLLDKGANIQAMDRGGKSVYQYAPVNRDETSPMLDLVRKYKPTAKEGS